MEYENIKMLCDYSDLASAALVFGDYYLFFDTFFKLGNMRNNSHKSVAFA